MPRHTGTRPRPASRAAAWAEPGPRPRLGAQAAALLRKLHARPDLACRGLPVEWWYPPDQVWPPTRGPARHDPTVPAKQVCARCPAVELCLAYALEAPERDGIWGGLTPWERAQLLTARRRTQQARNGPQTGTGGTFTRSGEPRPRDGGSAREKALSKTDTARNITEQEQPA